MATPAAAAPSPADAAMIRAAHAERARTISLLEKLVDQNSGSLNLTGVEAVGRMMREELKPLGCAFAERGTVCAAMRSVDRAADVGASARGHAPTRRRVSCAAMRMDLSVMACFPWDRSE